MIFEHSQIWTTDTIEDIHARAQGNYRLGNFKTFREIPGFDELVFLASGLTRFPLEGYKEKCQTETVLGGRFSSRPLVIDTPIYVGIDAGLGDEAREALAKGASLASTAVSAGGRMSVKGRGSVKKLIYEISSLDGRENGSSGSKSFHAIKADGIQINAATYGNGAKDLALLITRIRKETKKEIPIFVSIPASQVRGDVIAAAKAGADAVVLQGFRSVTCSDSKEIFNLTRVPMPAAIAIARRALREIKLLGAVDLIASTGIRNGADAAKALALGASAVVINESALIALNYLPLIPGASKSSDNLQKEQLNPGSGKGEFDTTGERLAKFVNSMTMEMALLARSLGKGDVHSLEFEDLSALTIEASMMTGIRLCGE